MNPRFKWYGVCMREFYIEYGNYERGQEAIPISLFKSSFVCTIIGNRTTEIYALNYSQLEFSIIFFMNVKIICKIDKRQFLSVIIKINQVSLTLSSINEILEETC